jgi:hypothetical protein
MKYFTPDLLARFGSANDQIADSAQQEWEQAHEVYVKHLEAIGPMLPPPLQSLLDRCYLHDAKVLTMALGDNSFSIMLKLDTPRGEWIELRYSLKGKPKFIVHPDLVEKDVPLEWLYDEIAATAEDNTNTLTHSILFTGGRELELSFDNLAWMVYQAVVSPVGPLQKEWVATELEALLT